MKSVNGSNVFLHRAVLYSSIGIFLFFPDINECDMTLNLCDDHATCENTDGDYECQCSDGYEHRPSDSRKCYSKCQRTQSVKLSYLQSDQSGSNHEVQRKCWLAYFRLSIYFILF